MASRTVLQEQNRGGDAVVNPKNMAAQGRNRRALGDIGNMVTLRPTENPLPQRPVTRSFCAQLLANAQAVADQNKKKTVKVNLQGDDVGKVVPKRVANQKMKKEVTVKPNPQSVIEISPDTEEKRIEAANHQPANLMEVDHNLKNSVKEEKAVVVSSRKNKSHQSVIEISPDTEEQRIEAENHQPANLMEVDHNLKNSVKEEKAVVVSSRKNKSHQSLTSILSARSKAVSGLSIKSKEEQIADIDALDVDNELAAVEYVEDMYKFYKSVENESRVHDYIDSQPEINERMRAILIDWLIEVHNKFELMKETLYLTINIVDRFLASETVYRKELQLVGVSAMLMASKYEEIWAPEVNDFVCISDRTYTHQQILNMEKRILGKLEWTLTVPTPYVFLVRFIKAASLSSAEPDLENLVNFFAELGIMNYECVRYCPSMLAAGAVYAARCTLNKNLVWNKTLELHTGFSEGQVTECAKLLVSFHGMMACDHKLKVIYRKYSSPQRGAVAFFPPAKALLAAGFVSSQGDR